MVKERHGPSSPSPHVKLSGDPSENRVWKGYVPVLVGKDVATMERLHMPTKLVGHPFVAALLELSANELGYKQQGLLRIPYNPGRLFQADDEEDIEEEVRALAIRRS